MEFDRRSDVSGEHAAQSQVLRRKSNRERSGARPGSPRSSCDRLAESCANVSVSEKARPRKKRRPATAGGGSGGAGKAGRGGVRAFGVFRAAIVRVRPRTVRSGPASPAIPGAGDAHPLDRRRTIRQDLTDRSSSPDRRSHTSLASCIAAQYHVIRCIILALSWKAVPKCSRPIDRASKWHARRI